MPDRTPVPTRPPGHASRRRLGLVLGAVLVVLAAVNVADKYGPPHTGPVAGPLVALGLVLLGRRAGLSWYDLGLTRRTLLPGLNLLRQADRGDCAMVFGCGACR